MIPRGVSRAEEAGGIGYRLKLKELDTFLHLQYFANNSQYYTEPQCSSY